MSDTRPRHGRTCSSDPEIGCECGLADWQADHAWPGEDAWSEALAWDSVEQQGEQLATAAQIECPVCSGDGCRACAGEGWVWATTDDEAAMVAFRQAAAAYLHPSGLAER